MRSWHLLPVSVRVYSGCSVFPPTIKNMCQKLIIQSVFLTRSTDEDLDLVPEHCIAASHCSSEADESNFTVLYVYMTNNVYFILFHLNQNKLQSVFIPCPVLQVNNFAYFLFFFFYNEVDIKMPRNAITFFIYYENYNF